MLQVKVILVKVIWIICQGNQQRMGLQIRTSKMDRFAKIVSGF